MKSDQPSSLLTRSAVLAGTALLVALPWPWALGLANASYLMVLGATIPFWLLLAALHEPEERPVFARIAVIAVATRVVAHLAVYGWAVSGGGPYLGPDSTMYYEGSRDLATRGFVVDGPAALAFGSYNSAHYYLFAAVRWLFGADLYGLQTLNSAVTAFAGPLFYSGWRSLGLRYAVAFGVGVAVSPSLVALSVNDLLKDPAIFGVTTIGIWSLLRLRRSASPWEAGALATLATVSLAYVRTSRFYVVAFLEVALLALLVAWWFSVRRPAHAGRSLRPAAAITATLLLVELLPALLGWPLTPQLLVAEMRHSVATPLMHTYAAGLVDARRTAVPVGEETDGAVPARRVPRANPGQPKREFTPAEDDLATRAPSASAPARRADSLGTGALRTAANTIRKLLGPFPWIAPPTWTPRTVLLGDYLLFPGVIVWYALFPVSLVGFGLIAWRSVHKRMAPVAVVALAVFGLLLVAQYLALNLSYRQREFFVPFLAGIALIALQSGAVSRGWKVAYGTYWALLAVMAMAHLAVRAALA
jgi:hypothetical protein